MSKPDWIIQQERELYQALEILQQEYQRQARPYVQRLLALRNLYPEPIVLTLEEYQKLGLNLTKG